VVEPFVQAGDIMTRSHDRSGLGLPLSKRHIVLHSRTPDIESEVGVEKNRHRAFSAEMIRSFQRDEQLSHKTVERSASGQKEKFWRMPIFVRFTPNYGRKWQKSGHRKFNAPPPPAAEDN